jgi:hypothetical protein
MKTVRTVAIVGLLISSIAAGATIILGPGAASCGTWIGDRQRNEARSQLNQAWVQGFVTARNVYKPQAEENMPKPMDSRAMVAWIDNYCDANPLKDISDAAKALVEDLEGRTLQ